MHPAGSTPPSRPSRADESLMFGIPTSSCSKQPLHIDPTLRLSLPQARLDRGETQRTAQPGASLRLGLRQV